MRAVLISIKPKWCEKIANGEKTIEVRKSRPKLETPFKVYIYATKPKKWFRFSSWGYASNENLWLSNGKVKMCDGFEFWAGDKEYEPLCCKVIGEFVCDRIDEYRAEFTDLQYSDARHKEVCQNTIKWVERDDENEETVYRYETSNEEDDPDNCKFLKRSCLTFNEVRKYIGETFFDIPFYGWHITDLKIYDKPKELSEFKKQNVCYKSGDWETLGCWEGGCVQQELGECDGRCSVLERPPQSWCYVEELQNGDNI